MNIWDINSLLIFILFVVPGVITLKIYELASPARQVDTSKQIVDAITYSCINYAVMLAPIMWVERGNWSNLHPAAYSAFNVFVILGFPVLLAIAWTLTRRTTFAQRYLPHPTQKPWDYVFGKKGSYWVVVSLKTGKKIAGLYSDDSFTSSAPADDQIFLEQEWLLNESGGFDRPVDQTAGILVLSSDIESISLIREGETINE